MNLGVGPIVSIFTSFEHILVLTTKNRQEANVLMLDFAAPCLDQPRAISNRDSINFGSYESVCHEPAEDDENDLWMDASENLEEGITSIHAQTIVKQ